MALTILPYNDRGPSKSERKAEAFREAIGKGFEMYENHQKKKRLGEALKGVEDIYSSSDLSQEQKFIKAFSSLKEFPEVAKEFTSGLSRFNESPLQKAQRENLELETGQMRGEEEAYNRLTRGDQPQEAREMESGMPDEMEEEPIERVAPKRNLHAPKKASAAKFNRDDPSTWTDKQVNAFRSYSGKNVKYKTLAKLGQSEHDKRKEDRKTLGGVTAQPVPEEVSGAISQVLEQHPQATADELNLAMNQAGVPTIFSNSYVENRRRKDEQLASEERTGREFEQKRAYKAIEDVDSLAQSLPQQEQALNLMDHALGTGNLSFFSLNNLADATGLDFFRNPEGALFKTGAKEFLLGDLGRVKGRPNQYIEQQVMDSLGKVGQSQAANMIVTRAKRNEIDLKKQRVEVTNRIANEWKEKTGRLPWNLTELATKELNGYATAKEKEMFNEFKAINAIEEGKWQEFESVEPGTVPSKVILQAVRNKYPDDVKAGSKFLEKLGYQL